MLKDSQVWRTSVALVGAALLLGSACSSTTNPPATTASSTPGGSTPGSSGSGGSGGSTPPTTASYPNDGSIKLNQIQVIGSHNSYHVRTPKALRDKVDETLGSNVSSAWDYEHTSLDTQFGKEGVRQIEIDVHLDPDGRFAVRHALPALSLIHISEPTRPY